MTRTEFVIATAIILFVAYLMGWVSNWMIHRLTRVSQADLGEIERMAQATHDAEETRDQAIAYLQAREAEMIARMHEVESELRTALDRLHDAQEENADLRRRLDQVEA